MYNDLTPSEKFVFDWQYHIGGGFHTQLAHLFCKADSDNFKMLALAFPKEGLGMHRYLYENMWWEKVMRKAFDGKMENMVDVLRELQSKPHIMKKPPEWAIDYAQGFARQCFGLFFTLPAYEKTIMPTEDINAVIDRITESSPSYEEWQN